VRQARALPRARRRADGDPAKWESDGQSYLTYEDADRSARLTLAAKLLPR
jgi:hypothetical protein